MGNESAAGKARDFCPARSSVSGLLPLRLNYPGISGQIPHVPLTTNPPRKLGLDPARRTVRLRRERHVGRIWLVLSILAIGLALAFGGPGRKWWYSIRHYRWLSAAQAAFERGDLPTTSWTARRVLERDPTNLRAVLLLAEAATRQGRRDAVYWRSRAVELDPDDSAKLLAWAKTAEEFNDLSTAVIALGRIPESARDTMAYAETAAEIAEAQGDPDLAARHLDAALSMAPGSPEAELRLAAAQLRARSESVRSQGRGTLDRLKRDARWRRDALLALAREAIASSRAAEALDETRELFAWGHHGWQEQLLRAEALLQHAPAEFPEHLLAMQTVATAARDSLDRDALGPVRLIEWMGRHQLANEALEWVKTLPNETSRTRPRTLAIARLHAQAGNWLGLRAWTKNPSWADDEPLRLAYQALALHRGPPELRTPGSTESLWNQALKFAARDPARLERIANWTTEWNLPNFAETSWWALANSADDPAPALDQLARIYRQLTDIHGRFRVAQRQLETHPFDRLAAAETAYLGLLLDATEPDPHQLAAQLRRQPPLPVEGVLACAFSLWRRDRVREAVALFEVLPIPTREDPSVAWFYGTILAAAGDTTKAGRYLALGAAYPRSAVEEKMFREARLRVSKR